MGSLQTIQTRGQVQWNDINALAVKNQLGADFKRETSVIFSMVWLLWLYCNLKVTSHISGMSEESRFRWNASSMMLDMCLEILLYFH